MPPKDNARDADASPADDDGSALPPEGHDAGALPLVEDADLKLNVVSEAEDDDDDVLELASGAKVQWGLPASGVGETIDGELADFIPEETALEELELDATGAYVIPNLKDDGAHPAGKAALGPNQEVQPPPQSIVDEDEPEILEEPPAPMSLWGQTEPLAELLIDGGALPLPEAEPDDLLHSEPSRADVHRAIAYDVIPRLPSIIPMEAEATAEDKDAFLINPVVVPEPPRPPSILEQPPPSDEAFAGWESGEYDDDAVFEETIDSPPGELPPEAHPHHRRPPKKAPKAAKVSDEPPPRRPGQGVDSADFRKRVVAIEERAPRHAIHIQAMPDGSYVKRNLSEMTEEEPEEIPAGEAGPSLTDYIPQPGGAMALPMRQPATHPTNTGASLASPGAQSSQAVTARELTEFNPSRYVEEGTLGTGAQGEVIQAFDRHLLRPVAVKSLRQEHQNNRRAQEAFFREAQITGQLTHPHIVPVYELGRRDDGTPFFIMKLLSGQNLGDVLRKLRLGDSETERRFPRYRLIDTCLRVCQAVGYAHSRGVIHRDLKPSNILLGDFGEVLVADWGIAKVLGQDEKVVPRIDQASRETMAGVLKGTPPYMSPEQVMGLVDEVDTRSDVYALGAILYEVLTYQPVFDPTDLSKVMKATREALPVPPRARIYARGRRADGIPPELETLCLRCLQKDPTLRPHDAQALARELEAIQQGAQIRARADALVEEAQTLVRRHDRLKAQIDKWQGELDAARERVPAWARREAKRKLWNLEEKIDESQMELHSLFAEVEDAFERALAHVPDHAAARAGLASLYWGRFTQAEADGTQHLIRRYRRRIELYDDGSFARRLTPEGQLSVVSNPPGAEVWLYEFQEVQRILQSVNPRRLGRTPMKALTLPVGAYLLVLKHPRAADTRYPVVIRRQKHHEAQVNLFSASRIGAGFVHVPAGPAQLGGDRRFPERSLHGREQVLGDFFIQIHPVTFDQYIPFLNDLTQRDAKEAERRCPGDPLNGPLLEKIDGRWQVRRDYLVDPKVQANTHYPRYPGFERELPCAAISAEDAQTFLTWWGARIGRELTLPTESQWEKATRGTDGRLYPWGNHFDPSFCHMRSSRPYPPQMEPVGQFEADTSVYGVRELAGCIRDLCLSDNPSEGRYVLKGGGWGDFDHMGRAPLRERVEGDQRRPSVGFRAVAAGKVGP